MWLFYSEETLFVEPRRIHLDSDQATLHHALGEVPLPSEGLHLSIRSTCVSQTKAASSHKTNPSTSCCRATKSFSSPGTGKEFDHGIMQRSKEGRMSPRYCHQGTVFCLSTTHIRENSYSKHSETEAVVNDCTHVRPTRLKSWLLHSGFSSSA